MRGLATALQCFALIAVLASVEAGAGPKVGGGFKQDRERPAAPAESEESGAPAGMDPDILGAFSPTRFDRAAMQARGFFTTGLQPVYPADAKCPKGTSEFASPLRTDGSRRSRRYFDGLHGGYDIPVDDGTPILAMADGVVVQSSVGESIGGLKLILQHPPEATGLGVWVYTEYKHLREAPSLALGVRVRAGEVVAHSGKSGTTVGHYGEEGFAHLHLTVWYAAGPEFKAARMFVPRDGYWMDPLALFLPGGPVDSRAVAQLSVEAKKVRISYRTTDGRTVPEGARVVWPFACPTD